MEVYKNATYEQVSFLRLMQEREKENGQHQMGLQLRLEVRIGFLSAQCFIR